MSDLCATNIEYLQCVQVVKRDLVTATAAIAALTSFCMGLFANMPIALAPGMGLNAYFAYTVVGFHGSGKWILHQFAHEPPVSLLVLPHQECRLQSLGVVSRDVPIGKEHLT
jgi:hypothetical protein